MIRRLDEKHWEVDGEASGVLVLDWRLKGNTGCVSDVDLAVEEIPIVHRS